MQLIFIRHGEKSKESGVHLSHKGHIRAINLPDYLIHPYNDFHKPDKFYIMERLKENRSERCYETMLPTIKQTPTIPYELVPRYETFKFANDLKTIATSGSNTYKDKTYLICWQHSRIVDLLQILGVSTVQSWGRY